MTYPYKLNFVAYMFCMFIFVGKQIYEIPAKMNFERYGVTEFKTWTDWTFIVVAMVFFLAKIMFMCKNQQMPFPLNINRNTIQFMVL